MCDVPIYFNRLLKYTKPRVEPELAASTNHQLWSPFDRVGSWLEKKLRWDFISEIVKNKKSGLRGRRALIQGTVFFSKEILNHVLEFTRDNREILQYLGTNNHNVSFCIVAHAQKRKGIIIFIDFRISQNLSKSTV